MKRFLPILICLLFGCKNFETKKLSPQEILEEELEHIDWKNLDTYPTFTACADIAEADQKMKCFKREFSKHIFTVLAKHEVQLKDSVREVVELKILITQKGEPKLESVKISDSLKNKIPDLENWIEDALTDLPTIYPAEKRGIPVSSSFKLPLVIQSE